MNHWNGDDWGSVDEFAAEVDAEVTSIGSKTIHVLFHKKAPENPDRP